MLKALCTGKGSALCTGRGSALYTGKGSALCTKGSKLCAQAGGFQALCTGRGSALYTGKGSALCTGKGSALCTKGSKLCVQARLQALCTKGFKLCAHKGSSSVHKRVQALCTGKGSALCTKGLSSVHKRAQLCAQAGAPSSVYRQGFKLCAQKAPSSVHRQGFSSVYTQEDSGFCAQKGSSSVHKRVQALCTKGFKLCAHAGGLLVKNRVFELSDRTSLSSTVFYNPLPRHIHGKSNSFSASLGAKSILEKGLSTYFAESPLDFSVFLDFKSAKSTSVHREHLQKRLYPVFLPEPELPHLLQQSPSCYFCTGAGYSFALKSA